eukprot:275751_1
MDSLLVKCMIEVEQEEVEKMKRDKLLVWGYIRDIQYKTLSNQFIPASICVVFTNYYHVRYGIQQITQLRNMLQVKNDQIEQLTKDVQELNDRADDMMLLYQVKEQEVDIAMKENERLRKKKK